MIKLDFSFPASTLPKWHGYLKAGNENLCFQRHSARFHGISCVRRKHDFETVGFVSASKKTPQRSSFRGKKPVPTRNCRSTLAERKERGKEGNQLNSGNAGRCFGIKKALNSPADKVAGGGR